jgi:ATP/maltotriose-dependent transcriptional regulator MalT
MLDLLAVGEPLPPAVLDAGAVDGCERRGLVVVDASGPAPMLRLHHPLLGEVLRASLTAGDRRHLARRLAQLHGTAGLDPLRAAAWSLDGGMPADPEQLVAAAGDALRRFDAGLAERLARAAADGRGGRPAALALARALIAQERYAEAEAVLIPLEAAADDIPGLLAVAKLLADVRFWGLGRPDDAEAALVDVGERLGDEVARLHVLALRASIRNDAGDITGALALTDWALDADADVGARLQAVTAAASALTHAARPVEALALCDELLPVALARADETPRDVGRVLGQRIHALVALGRLDEAHDVIAFVHGLAAEAGDDEVQGGAALVLGQLALERGRVDDAASWLRESAIVLRRFDPQRYLPWCLGLTAQVAALAGDVTAAEAAAAQAEDQAAAAPVHVFDVRVALGRAHAIAAGGELTRAAAMVLGVVDRADARGDRFSAALALEAALGFGAPPAALAERFAELDSDGQVPWIGLWRDHATALATGDGAALEAVGERYASFGVELRAAAAFEQAAAHHERAGRRSSATRARARATRHLAACPGVAAPAAPPLSGGPASLTRRELEIARLAAAGLSNAAIAERLTVGIRTVEGHLLRASTKLGVRGRAGLADALGSGARHA